MFIRALLLVTLLISVSTSAKAETEDTILALPDGQVILSISATERREVEQDLLVATLSYNATNTNSRDLQNEINTVMQKALKEAKSVKEVKVNTGTYNVYETRDPRTKEKKWQGSQNLTIKSKDSDAVLKLAGKLQDMKLNMNGLNYTLAPDTAVEIQDSLMEDALKQLQLRADRAAKALGKSTAELRDVNVQGDSGNYQPISYARSMAMDMEGAAMAAPVASAGENTISLSVNARAILKP